MATPAPLTSRKRTLLVSVGAILPLALLVVWLMSGTPFIFTYSRNFPSSAKLETEPPILLLTVTNDTLRRCDNLEYSYEIVLTDGAVILGPILISPAFDFLGPLGPFETKTFSLPLADLQGGQVIVVPQSAASPARDMRQGELNGAKINYAKGYCVYGGITID